MASTHRPKKPPIIPSDFNTWKTGQLRDALDSWDIDFEANAKKADLVYMADHNAVRQGLGPRLAHTQAPNFSPNNWTVAELRRFFISEGADYRPRTMKRDMVEFFHENAFDSTSTRREPSRLPSRNARTSKTPISGSRVEHASRRSTTRSPSRPAVPSRPVTRSRSASLEPEKYILSSSDSDSNDDDVSENLDEDVSYYSGDNDNGYVTPPSTAKSKKSVVFDTKMPSFVSDKYKAKKKTRSDPAKQNRSESEYMMHGAVQDREETKIRGRLSNEKLNELVQLMGTALEQLSIGSVDQAKLLMIEAILRF